MDERAWLCWTDPAAMLEHLRTKSRATGRQLRLFACACCRHLPAWMRDEACLEAVEATERFADGLASSGELSQALNRSRRYRHWFPLRLTPRHVEEVRMAAAKAAADGLAERSYQCRLLRCIFGTPVRRRRAIEPFVLAWNGGVVPGLSQQIYDDRLPDGTLDPVRLAVLADALEEAGCEDTALIAHCREPAGVHVRGCWAVDVLLAKR